MNYKSLVFFLFATTLSQAQTQLSTADEEESYSLSECIDYALGHNISLRQSQLAVENSIVGLNQSKSDLLPTLNGSFNLNSNFGRNIDPFSNNVVTNAIGTNSIGAGARVVVYNGYRKRNTIDRNTLDLAASQLDLEAQKNNISLNVAVAYLSVLSSEDVIEVAEQNLIVTRLQLERTQKLVSAGALAETNIFNLNAQLANDQLNLVNAQNGYRSSILTLKQNMNLMANKEIQVVRVKVPSPSSQIYPETPAEVYEAAIFYLPEVKSSQIREEMAEKNIQIAKSVGLPSVFANVNWGSAFSTAAKNITPGQPTLNAVNASATFDGQVIPFTFNVPQQNFNQENIPYFSQLGNNQNMNAGISVQIPIFNGYNKKYQMQSAQIQKLQSILTTQSTKVGIRQNIDQAYINMLNASQSYRANTAQVDALRKAFEAAEASYNAGASNFVDYNLAKTNLDRALANQIQSKYDYIFKIKILDFYQNKPLVF
ncbi:MAG: outer membrane protein [Psychromonas sp.]|jgi:outer membrane protein